MNITQFDIHLTEDMPGNERKILSALVNLSIEVDVAIKEVMQRIENEKTTGLGRDDEMTEIYKKINTVNSLISDIDTRLNTVEGNIVNIQAELEVLKREIYNG